MLNVQRSTLNISSTSNVSVTIDGANIAETYDVFEIIAELHM